MKNNVNRSDFAPGIFWMAITALAGIVAVPARAAADDVFLAGAVLERVWDEGVFTEGPAQGPDGCIYFSDIPNHRIMKYDPVAGTTTTYRKPNGGSNGLDFDPKGRLVAAEGAGRFGNRRISITDRDGTVRTLTDRWQGKRLNGPNDLTVDAKGRVYFTDPRHEGNAAAGRGAVYVPAGERKDATNPSDARRVAKNDPWEIDTESVYRVELDGTVTQLIVDVAKPNGILLAPDMRTLYVADTGAHQLLAFALRDDGSVGPKKVLVDFAPDRGIDGMCIDAKGRIFGAAGRGATSGIHVISPAGEKLAFVAVPEIVTNCTFGGADRRTLYVTAGRSLYRLKTAVEGFAVFWPGAN